MKRRQAIPEDHTQDNKTGLRAFQVGSWCKQGERNILSLDAPRPSVLLSMPSATDSHHVTKAKGVALELWRAEGHESLKPYLKALASSKRA